MFKYAKVLLNISLNRHYDYAVPELLASEIKVGSRVIVPLRNRKIEGSVIALSDETSHPDGIKEICSVCYKIPVIPENLLELGEWIASYYCCSREQALNALLPAAVRTGKIGKKQIYYIFIKDQDKATEFLFKNQTKSEHQKSLIKALLKSPDMPMAALKKITGASEQAINALISKGIIEKEKRDVGRDPFHTDIISDTSTPELTDEQRRAVDAISEMIENKEAVSTALLFGVTGSGKTEVYLQSIKEVLSRGKETIVLVPEIALTPQTTERFRARFGNMVSVLHSALTDGERYDEWMKIYEGRVKIVVGARSALFAPFKNLGLIVVDEEHENSYKQDEAPRYNARDVAVLRAHLEKAVAVLGSATPSLESYYNASTGKYRLLKLEKRIDSRLMPNVVVVDKRGEATSGTNAIFSKLLIEAIYHRLSKYEQTIIFLNRRGFATHMICPVCGYTATCQNCAVDYTYHKGKNFLSCHICGDVIEAYRKCPACDAPDIKYSGLGTEKIEEIARTLFPHARIDRMDSDTMVSRKSYESILSQFRKGKIDILIGTQMLAKGLDFPNVTLVGIINADTGLHMPDFRASERTFQLLTQVAGRAGRGVSPGEVYIQTFTPEHSAVQCAAKHDYEGFYNYEIPVRRELSYPPFSRMALIRFACIDEVKLIETAERFCEKLQKLKSETLRISPLVPAPMPKANNKFRYLVMLRGTISSAGKAFIRELIFNEFKGREVSISADIDAVSMM